MIFCMSRDFVFVCYTNISEMGRKGNELSNDVKKVVWSLLENGDYIQKVSEILGIPPSTISSVKKRTEERGSVENIRTRPPNLSDRHYRRLERLVKTNRRESLIEITNKFHENIDQPVAKHAAQLHLHKHGFSRRVSKKKVVLKESNKKKWLAWSRGKRRLIVQNN